MTDKIYGFSHGWAALITKLKGRLDEVEAMAGRIVVAEAKKGETLELQQPCVLRDLCIGGGICENHCPLEGEAAIRVYGLGERV